MVVQALVSAGFTVSVLSRSVTGPKVPFPDTVKVITTDYTSPSLQSALKGQDAIVSCIGYPGLTSQMAVIDAAEAVGVRRFIPSEFGGDTRIAGLEEVDKLMLPKRQVLERLNMVAEKNESFSWTALATGPFIDWVGISRLLPTSPTGLYNPFFPCSKLNTVLQLGPREGRARLFCPKTHRQNLRFR